MRVRTLFLLLSGLQLATAAPSVAASFQATPVNVEIQAPGSSANVTIKNEANAPLNAQIRVFRWSIVDGQEKLEPATELVASPPMALVAAKSDQIIRLVRVAKTPVAGEETYRIFVDEIPDPAQRKANQIGIALRYSIPVFVMPSTPSDPQLNWTVERSGGETYVAATNSGGRRMKISSLHVKDASGASISLGEGLNGYVLARSRMRWVLPTKAQKLGLNGPVVISARGDDGPINAQAMPSAVR